MSSRPYVLVSVAASLDGFIDDATPQRLLLSNDADFDRVDSVRASMDAILVGAGTLRADNPRLMVRSAERRAQRAAASLVETPIKVTLTTSGKVDPHAKFFTEGDAEKIVYTTPTTAPTLTERLENRAVVVPLKGEDAVATMLTDLTDRGVQRLMVEGGSQIQGMFLKAGVVDELHLVIAPFLLGDDGGARFAGNGRFPQGPGNPMRLLETRTIGECVLLRYGMNP